MAQIEEGTREVTPYYFPASYDPDVYYFDEDGEKHPMDMLVHWDDTEGKPESILFIQVGLVPPDGDMANVPHVMAYAPAVMANLGRILAERVMSGLPVDGVNDDGEEL